MSFCSVRSSFLLVDNGNKPFAYLYSVFVFLPGQHEYFFLQHLAKIFISNPYTHTVSIEPIRQIIYNDTEWCCNTTVAWQYYFYRQAVLSPAPTFTLHINTLIFVVQVYLCLCQQRINSPIEIQLVELALLSGDVPLMRLSLQNHLATILLVCQVQLCTVSDILTIRLII